MKVYKYKNYNEYVECQTAAFNRKRWNLWAVEKNIEYLSDFINATIPNAMRGLCHGVRQGIEQQWFMKHLGGMEVIGSEIGGVISDNTVKWDFNKVNIEWIGKFDFIYSNSFDHAFNPVETLRVWAGQVKAGGLIMLEYDKRQEHTGEISKSVNKTDPVSITVDELIEKIPEWLSGLDARVVMILDMPVVKKEFQKTIVIQVG
jgi:hypothetical protein